MDTKLFFQSKTIIGAAVMILSFVLAQFGLSFIASELELTDIITKIVDVANNLIFIFGALMTIYGRFRARQQLSLPGKS